MADISRVVLTLSDLKQGGETCSNPTITFDAPKGVDVICEPGDDSIQVILSPDAESHCVTFTVDCEDCDTCPPQTFTECFCDNNGDCGDCEYCDTSTNLCVSTCPEDKICVGNDICGDCTVNTDCECNQICVGNDCVCPPGYPYLAKNGCCVACLKDEDCGPCEDCDGTDCVPKVCPEGSVCNPGTGNCSECVFDSDCTDPNECCQKDGTCDCCDGYYRDASGNCVKEPPCFPGECPDCYDCDPDLGCVPRQCPTGFVCIDDNCEPGCTNGACPEGEGCINGACVPCNELSCTGTGLQCVQAAGCECDDNDNCVGIDCSPSNVGVTLETTQATAGTVTSPGQSALQGSGTATALGIVGPPIYQNHRFDLSISGVTGNWVLLNTPTSSQNIGTNTSSVSFDLASTGPNMVGFLVQFTSSSGNTGVFEIFRNPTAPLDAANVWTINFSSSGVPPTTSGGSPGVTRLCVNNGDWDIVSVNYSSVQGDIVVTPLGLDNDGCMILNISGCGIATGTAQLKCGSLTLEVQLPEIEVPESSCCDPQTDLGCPVGVGAPCTSISIENIDLIAHPTYAQASDGDGEFLIIADFTSVAGLDFSDLFYLNPSFSCWSTSDNNGVNDLGITTGTESPFGGSTSALSLVITMGEGGCVRFGHSCVLRISGCRRLQGEVCLEECSDFDVYIQDLGSDMYKALPSLGDEPITYAWSYPTLPTASTQTVAITPQGGTSTLSVTASYGSPVKCSATDSLVLNTTITGCTEQGACNYDSSANSNLNCIYVEDVRYSCSNGFTEGTVTNNESVSYSINGASISEGSTLAAGTYTLDITGNGFSCQQDFVVPQCYVCSGDSCLAAIPPITASNLGAYTNDSTCNNECDLCGDFEVNLVWSCTGNDGQVSISATGGSGNYSYTVSQIGGGFAQTGTLGTASAVLVNDLCNGNYTVTVRDLSDPAAAQCVYSESNTISCFDCNNSTLAITASAASDYCSTNNVILTITDNAPCNNTYDVSVDLGSSSLDFEFSQDGTHNRSISLDDGSYPVTITDANGCTGAPATLVINCAGAGVCNITSTNSVSFLPDSTQIDVNYNLANGSGTVQWNVYESTAGATTASSCPTATYDSTAIASGSTSSGSFDFLVPNDVSTKCYRIVINDIADTSCNETTYVFLPALTPPPSCSVDSACNDIVFNSTTEALDINWIFSNSPSGVDVVVEELDACPSGNVLSTTTYSGAGQNGTISHSVNQEPTDTFYRVTITSLDDDSCELECCKTVPSCTCTISQVDLTYNELTEELTVEYDSDCTTQPTSLLITVDEMTDSLCTTLSSSITSTLTSSPSGIEVFNISQGTSDRYINVTVEDATLSSCLQTDCITIPSCTVCSSQSLGLPSTRVSIVTTTEGTEPFVGAGFTTCSGSDVTNDDFASDLQDLLRSLEECGTATVTYAQVDNTGSGGTAITVGECLTYNQTHSGAGTDVVTLEQFVVQGTTYPVNQQIATYSAGTPTLTAGAAQAIADALAAALDDELVAFGILNVYLGISGSDVQVGWQILEVDNTATVTTRVDVGGVDQDDPASTSCTEPTFGDQTAFSYSEFGCVTFTVTGSGIQLVSASDSQTTFTADTSGC